MKEQKQIGWFFLSSFAKQSKRNMDPAVQTHDQRLDRIIQQAPPSRDQEKTTFVAQARKFCMSKIGMAVITFVVLFLLFLFLQPVYIFRKK